MNIGTCVEEKVARAWLNSQVRGGKELQELRKGKEKVGNEGHWNQMVKGKIIIKLAYMDLLS